jgi:hypothetical protein
MEWIWTSPREGNIKSSERVSPLSEERLSIAIPKSETCDPRGKLRLRSECHPIELSDTLDERRPTVLRKVDMVSSERMLSSVRVVLLNVEEKREENQRKDGGVATALSTRSRVFQGRGRVRSTR